MQIVIRIELLPSSSGKIVFRLPKWVIMINLCSGYGYILNPYLSRESCAITRPTPQGPLFKLPHWIPQCIRFDSMHVLCLGIDLLVSGNVIHSLLAYDFWGNGDEYQKLLVGWQHFKSWAKRNGWQPPALHYILIFAPVKN